MIVQCSNKRTLQITEPENFNEKELSNLIPRVVLIVAWDSSDVTYIINSNLIEKLLVKGTRNFVCLGDFSEQLHDIIDDLIYQFDEENNLNISKNVLTTYHSDETIEDSVNYFINGTELERLGKESCLLAIIDKNSIQNRSIVSALENG